MSSLSLHIGNAGTHIGLETWKLYYNEYENSIIETQNRSTYFHECVSGKL